MGTLWTLYENLGSNWFFKNQSIKLNIDLKYKDQKGKLYINIINIITIINIINIL